MADNRDNLNDRVRSWVNGIPYEVAFWRSYYGNSRRLAALMEWSGYGKPCRLDSFDVDRYVSGLDTARPIILDVGCALSYAFGNVINGAAMDVHYVDPLAPFYNDILRDSKVERPAIRYGMVEMLSAVYPADSVDFIHIRNALDHCADPMEGILQSLCALKPGRVLYLNHFVNEAEREGYRGFHQFNICMEDNRLVIWNRTRRIDVADVVKEFADVEVSLTPEGRVVATLTKRAAVPEAVCSPAATARRACGDLMAAVYGLNPLSAMARYQWMRLYSTIGHRIMRLLPMGSLESVKSIFRRLRK